MLLLESSDWQFLITTGAARDYAEQRFMTHYDQFNDLKQIWEEIEAGSDLTEEKQRRLEAIAERDSIFREIDPGMWASGAREDLHGSGCSPRVEGDGLKSDAADHDPVQDSSLSELPKFIPTGTP